MLNKIVHVVNDSDMSEELAEVHRFSQNIKTT